MKLSNALLGLSSFLVITSGLSWSQNPPERDTCERNVDTDHVEQNITRTSVVDDDGQAQTNPSLATKLTIGTELFQDTIYSKPLISSNVPSSHALIEGARGRLRLQSDLLASEPEEAQFLDRDYHFGPPEIVQFEQLQNGDWELVHYYHPFHPRQDGARTDGLARGVIMTKDDGLVAPKSLHSITGTYTNRYTKDGSDSLSTLRYALFVHQDSGGSFVVIGTGSTSMPSPYNATSNYESYPIEWASKSMEHFESLGISNNQDLLLVDKYTSHAWQSNFDTHDVAQYNATQAVEHILLYYEDFLVVLTLLDTGGSHQCSNGNTVGSNEITLSHIPYPSDGGSNSRVLHIDWDPTQFCTQDWRRLANVVMVSSEKDNEGDVTYHTFTMNRDGNTKNPNGEKVTFSLDPPVEYTVITYENNWTMYLMELPASLLENGKLEVDYSNLRSVHGLYLQVLGGRYFYVKLANIQKRGIFAFSMYKVATPNQAAPYSPYLLFGHFPLAFPDGNGVGSINNFGGGTSKFGGLRFIANDANTNLFMMRQRGLSSTDTPYDKPIYGLYDQNGSPLSTINFKTFDQLPAGTSSSSNLHDLGSWIHVSAPPKDRFTSYNLILGAALAFGSDGTNSAQGVNLGSGYQAAYAMKRFGLDSDHVVIRETQDEGVYNAITMFKNPVDKTWRKRVIASQTLPGDPGSNESGDHYQTTLTLANVDGQPVSALNNSNANMRIEVRADSPCTVTDDTNNIYYDVDRYTSFMAQPNPSTGTLSLTVKADVFSQVIYARLVDTSSLQLSPDSALLSASQDTVPYAWQSVNMANQAQQRMGNGGTSVGVQSLGDDAHIADKNVYVSSETLKESNANHPWDTKGGYSPSDSNLGNLATYLTSSGINMNAETGELSLGAAEDGSTIDPLYAVTAVSTDTSRASITTTFAYNSGTVETDSTSQEAKDRMQALQQANVGDVFGSISHALHDALHWLQHAEGDVYKDLASGGVAIASAAEGITVTVGKDIMKQVNGVAEELNEVVQTIEEYASVVLNVLVSIVEDSFIYKFIELVIALISLFQHFEDILSLSKSFQEQFEGYFKSGSFPKLPDDFNSSSFASKYLGIDNDLDASLANVDSSNIATDIVEGVFNAVFNNPLTSKIINKVIAAGSNALEDIGAAMPFVFKMDITLASVEDLVNEIDSLGPNLTEGTADLVVNTAETFFEQLSEDLTNPQQMYKDIMNDLGTLAEGIVVETLEDVFDFVDSAVKKPPQFALDALNYTEYLTLNIPMLSDLCKLFGIGSVSGSTLKLSGNEAVYFPLATIIWVAVYMGEGKSINKFADIPAINTGDDVTASLTSSDLNTYQLLADWFFATAGGGLWVLGAVSEEGSDDAPVISCLGSWVGLIQSVGDVIFMVEGFIDGSEKAPTNDCDAFDYAATLNSLELAIYDVYYSFEETFNQEKLDNSEVFAGILSLVSIGVDTAAGVEEGESALSIVGNDIANTQSIAEFIFDQFKLGETCEYCTAVFALIAVGVPAGYLIQEIK